ncbi:MAG: tetratricopeptide repeat protein, partial [Clostridia bacterium]|nr:tetratricopeptide repeat protein [Clostridia bacterium]
EDLYLYGTHVEQYRHATRRAEDYYREGLKRDPTDLRLNGAMGRLLFRKGLIAESEAFFRRALKKATRSNPNPPTGEYAYDLALSLFYQEKYDEAFDLFYKACWNQDAQAKAFFFLALIEARRGHTGQALAFADEALIRNGRNFSAMNLKALLTGERSEALRYDGLNLVALYLAGEDVGKHLLNPDMLIDLALEIAMAGREDEAAKLLSLWPGKHPMIEYYKAYFTGDPGFLETAAAASPYCVFPNRIEDIRVLEYAVRENPKDFKAPYYLGCLYYDRERHADAVASFELSLARGADFATPYRNLALLAYNVLKDGDRALALMEKAFSLDESDARILYELDLLKKRLGVPPAERRKALEERMPLVESRDDLYLEYVTLLNLTGACEEALSRILSRRFHPWEGGEGKVPEQYIFSCLALGKYADAFVYPESLGEGKLHGAQENRQNYLLGLSLGDSGEAKEAFRRASTGISEPASAMYYNDQPPETIFYQGMALLALGEKEEAEKRFDKLIDYADLHRDDHVRIDYFAVSLPDLLVFDEDLDRKNFLHCLFMKALGLYGKGR